MTKNLVLQESYNLICGKEKPDHPTPDPTTKTTTKLRQQENMYPEVIPDLKPK